MSKNTHKVKPRRPEDVTFDQLSAMSLIADRSPAGEAAIKRWSDRFSDFADELAKWQKSKAQFHCGLAHSERRVGVDAHGGIAGAG